MKILNRKEFLEAPDGICFCKYSEGEKGICMDDYEGLSIKCKTYRHDEDDIPDENGKMDYKKGDGFDFGVMQLSDLNSFSRDGMFEEDQLFMVYEKKDIDKIIEVLKRASEKV